jgi:hypothetical protein
LSLLLVDIVLPVVGEVSAVDPSRPEASVEQP